MNISKDPKVISGLHVQKGTQRILKLDVGPSAEEVEGNVTYDEMIAAIEKGQVYQIHSKSGDPANVVVRDTDVGKVLTTGRDKSELNNLIGNSDLNIIEEGTTAEEREQFTTKEQVPEGAGVKET